MKVERHTTMLNGQRCLFECCLFETHSKMKKIASYQIEKEYELINDGTLSKEYIAQEGDEYWNIIKLQWHSCLVGNNYADGIVRRKKKCKENIMDGVQK